MMKEWQEARDQVAEMRKTDKKGAEQLNKEITEVNYYITSKSYVVSIQKNCLHYY